MVDRKPVKSAVWVPPAALIQRGAVTVTASDPDTGSLTPALQPRRARAFILAITARKHEDEPNSGPPQGFASSIGPSRNSSSQRDATSTTVDNPRLSPASERPWLRRLEDADWVLANCTTTGHRPRAAKEQGQLLPELWLIDPAAKAPLRDLIGCLDPAEQRRAQRYRSPADRHLFVAAHAGLRRVLAAHLGITPANVRFRLAPPGTRPRLACPSATGINFSLSHAYGLAVVAVSRDGRRVGVDIESTARPVSVLPLALRYLAPSEAERLAELDDDQRSRRFCLIWTRYEAVAKLTGRGLPAILQQARTGCAPADPRKIEFHHFAPTSRHVGTLALDRAVSG